MTLLARGLAVRGSGALLRNLEDCPTDDDLAIGTLRKAIADGRQWVLCIKGDHGETVRIDNIAGSRLDLARMFERFARQIRADHQPSRARAK